MEQGQAQASTRCHFVPWFITTVPPHCHWGKRCSRILPANIDLKFSVQFDSCNSSFQPFLSYIKSCYIIRKNKIKSKIANRCAYSHRHTCVCSASASTFDKTVPELLLPCKLWDLVSNEDPCSEMLLAPLPVPSPIIQKGFMQDLQLNRQAGLDDCIQKDLKHSLWKLPSRNII